MESDRRPAPSQVDARDPAGIDADAGSQDPGRGLIALLRAFKDARRRRDAADFGSLAWRDADDDIQRLQHEIFDGAAEEAARRDAVGRVILGPDDELGQPERPCVA
jgi:hypothetical protein